MREGIEQRRAQPSKPCQDLPADYLGPEKLTAHFIACYAVLLRDRGTRAEGQTTVWTVRGASTRIRTEPSAMGWSLVEIPESGLGFCRAFSRQGEEGGRWERSC